MAQKLSPGSAKEINYFCAFIYSTKLSLSGMEINILPNV